MMNIAPAGLEYFGLMVQHVAENKPVFEAVKGISKQAGWAVGGTVTGGVILGPLGAFFGGMIGSAIGLACADDYKGLINHLMALNDEQKSELVRQVREAVGADPISSFYTWYSKPVNQTTVHTLFLTAIAIAANPSRTLN